ncbi:MAG TPA: DUF983 domain-containing protein [Bryobacteraceae bacterium]|jgi:uncharacterized protein (DUF983 family)
MTLPIRDILREVCPRCRRGPIFRGPIWRGYLAIHEKCPVCGLKYSREPGYFLGAMYFSYLISILPVLGIVMVIWRWTNWPFDMVMLGGFAAYLPLAPFVTRLSRVIWMYMDRYFDPD